MASLALVIATIGPGAPAEAATITAPNGITAGMWVDGSDRLHTLLRSNGYAGQPESVRIARHRAGTVDLDSTYGDSGIVDVALDNPYPPIDTGTRRFGASVTETGFGTDGTVIVTWLATGGRVRSSGSESIWEYLHDDDRLVIDRYGLSGDRLSRAEVAMPEDSWCDYGYGAYRYDTEFSQWVRTGPQDYCGDDDRIGPSVDVLGNGAVAVPTFGHYRVDETTDPSTPVGTSSVAFYSAQGAAHLGTVSLPQARQVTGRIAGLGTSGATFNTTDWTFGDDSSSGAAGPSYVVSDWSTASTRSMPTDYSCRLWSGSATTTFRTCSAGGTIVVTTFAASGAQSWSRSIPSASGATTAAMQPDGQISLVAFGCETPGATCPSGSEIVLRLGVTGTIERHDVGILNAYRDIIWDAPVALEAGRQAFAVDRRPADFEAWSVETKLVGASTTPATVPAKPTAPSAVPGPAKATVSWVAPTDGGSAITGYRVTPYKNGVAQPPLDLSTITSTVFDGLTNGASYRFSVAARNAKGLGPASDLSAPVVPASVPGAPTSVQARAGHRSATVSWRPPGSNGGSPITGYTVKLIVSGRPLQDFPAGTATSLLVDDLAPGTIYTFEVSATNAIGTGPWSATSGPVTPPPNAFPQGWSQAVDRQYRDIAGRPPTGSEELSQFDQLQRATKTTGALVAELRAGVDGTSNVDPTTRLYSSYFVRTPDPSGLTYWVGKKRAGTNLARISAVFAASSEFERTYGPLSNAAFVELVYRNVLGRRGDASGVQYWTDQLDRRRKNRGEVMAGFSESTEHVRQQRWLVAVEVLYVFMLDRAPTADELRTEAAALAAGGSVADLADRIVATDEYTQRITRLP